MLKRYQDDRLAVIDLGTNAIRLNVYEGYVCIYQEKLFTGLGSSLAATGRLSRKGKTLVCQKLRHYKNIMASLEVDRATILATEALRTASDSPEFIDKLQMITDMPITILSGEEEAFYFAKGVAAAFPDAQGLVLDCGGGSIEVAQLDKGSVNEVRSFPYGVMRVRDALLRMRDPWHYMVSMLQENLWLTQQGHHQDMYISGGSWRMLAQYFIHTTDYPIMWINSFSPDLKDFKACLDTLPTVDFDTLKISRIRHQRSVLPTAAILLKSFIDVLNPRKIIFSAYGLREGYLTSLLEAKPMNDTPLISYARFEARGLDKAAARDLPEVLHDVPMPYAIKMAVYLLAGIDNKAPEGVKSDYIFLRIIEAPPVGLTHAEMIWMAYTTALYFGPLREEGKKAQLINFFLTPETKALAVDVAQRLRRLEGVEPMPLSTIVR